jgi:hypothetical protein
VIIGVGVLVLLALVVFVRMYFSTPGGLSQPPKWAAGDQWTWHNSDGPDVSFSVLRVQPDWYDVQVRSRGNTTLIRIGTDLSLQNADWFRFQWPLTPGHSWVYQVTGVVNGRNTTWQGTARAAAIESVTVPAGTFRAVRIDGRHCNLTTGGCGTFTLWYAPKAEYVIKLVVSNTAYWVPAVRGFSQELVAYRVQ